MWQFLEYAVQVVQVLFLVFVMGVAGIVPLIALYLLSEEFRDIVHDFEMWAAHRRLKKRMKHQNYDYEDDPEVAELIFEQSQFYPSIFDAVVEDRGVDPRERLRSEKAQQARDQEVLDRSTEYRNGISQ